MQTSCLDRQVLYMHDNDDDSKNKFAQFGSGNAKIEYGSIVK